MNVAFQILCHWRECFIIGPRTSRSQTGLLCVAQAEKGRGGEHKFHHVSLHGSCYSADLGDTILACRPGNAGIRASAKNEGKPAVHLHNAFTQELKKQVCNPDWKLSLPGSADLAEFTDELFGTYYEAMYIQSPYTPLLLVCQGINFCSSTVHSCSGLLQSL